MKIALIGYGKMGQAIEKNLRENQSIVARIDRHNAGYAMEPEELSRADVAIEFSIPEAAFDNINACIRAGVPVVSGTTGWLDRLPEVHANVNEQGGAFLYASNFSVGVNLFFAANAWLANKMANYAAYMPTISETHHITKKDAPSGTAITLAEQIMEADQRFTHWTKEPTAAAPALPIISHRVADVKGLHRVRYSSSIDALEWTHEAYSREGFAKGALLAAEWLIGKTGIYSMGDVLNTDS